MDIYYLMERNRSAYNNFWSLCVALNDFALNENPDTTEQLKSIIEMSNIVNNGMPLPSGRYGTALAVALEMQLYKGALFMIKNANELGIDLDSVSSEYGGKNVWSAQQTFEISQLGFEKTKVTDDDELYKELYKNNSWLVQFKNDNIDAALEISSILQDKMEKNIK